MGSRAATRKSQRRLRRRPGTASQWHGWRARLPQRRTCSRDPLGEKSGGLAQDQVLFLEPLHLALEAQHLGFIRLLLGQHLSRASRKLLIAPLAQLARAHIQLRSDVGERPTALNHTLGLISPLTKSFLRDDHTASSRAVTGGCTWRRRGPDPVSTPRLPSCPCSA